MATAMNTQPNLVVPAFEACDRFKLARENTGLTVEQFAELTGMSRATVNNYERRGWSRRRRQLYVKAWASATGTPASWLETGQVSPDELHNVEFLCFVSRFGGYQPDPGGQPVGIPVAA